MAFINILGVLIGIMSSVIAVVAGVVASFTEWLVAFIETPSRVMQLVNVLGVVVGVMDGLVAIGMVVAEAIIDVVGIDKEAGPVFILFTDAIGIANNEGGGQSDHCCGRNR